MNIAAAGNVEVPAYLVIIAKGYDVSREESANSLDDVWTARKDENSFSANGLIELLGVITIAEARGENWRATDEEIDRFLRKFNLT